LGKYSSSNFVRVVIVLELILVCFILYSFARMFYEGYQLDRYIAENEREYQEMLEENRRKNEDYLYFTSVQYLDKIAKQNFNKRNPGEEVIVISDEPLPGDEVDFQLLMWIIEKGLILRSGWICFSHKFFS